MTDLTGDPARDWPLFVKRFGRKSLDVLVAIAEHYKRAGIKLPGVEAILNAFDDLEEVWPLRHKILDHRGEVLRGGRSAIAKRLDVIDAGNYRSRIDSVIWLLKNYPDDLLEENEPMLEKNAVSPLTQLTDLLGTNNYCECGQRAVYALPVIIQLSPGRRASRSIRTELHLCGYCLGLEMQLRRRHPLTNDL